MQDLHGDFATGGVNRIRDNTVLCRLLRGGHNGSANPNAAFGIRADPTSDDQSSAARCAFCVKGGHAFEPMLRFFKPQMHRAHDHSIFQLCEAQIQGLKKKWIMGIGHRDLDICDAGRA